jgi:hypothetical protein
MFLFLKNAQKTDNAKNNVMPLTGTAVQGLGASGARWNPEAPVKLFRVLFSDLIGDAMPDPALARICL